MLQTKILNLSSAMTGRSILNTATHPTTASPTGLSRRKFLGATAAAAAGFSLVPRHVLGGAKFVPPSEKINVAIVGCGGQGQTNVHALFQQPDVQIIAVADPIETQDLHAFYYKSNAGRLPVKEEIEKYYGEKTPNFKVAQYRGLSRDAREGEGH